MTMPTILAQPIRHRIAGFALAPLAAIWLACVPAMAQVKVDSAQQTDKQAQKEVADKARQQLHQGTLAVPGRADDGQHFTSANM